MSAGMPFDGLKIEEVTTVLMPVVEGLPPRLATVLVCLIMGDSEKQIARRLRLSQHTVHFYVKDLHRKFGVNSRGELLALVFWQAVRNLKAQQKPEA